MKYGRAGPRNFFSRRCVSIYGLAVNDIEQLIRATLQGDSAAFGRVVQKYQDRLYNTMLHVVGDPDECLDVVQEAFVQAYLNLASFEGQSAFYTWLYRIAFNVAATHRRKKKPVQSVDAVYHESGREIPDRGPAPEIPLEQEERCRRVREAIAALNEEHRAILVLREIDGCCYETIAEILNVPIGTVRSRLHRARLMLREKLKEAYADLL